MREGETAIDDETALCFREKAVRAAAGFVEMNEGRGVSDVEGGEVEIFEDEFVEGVLDGREREEGFREEEGRLGRVYAEDGGEEVGPDFALEVGVY